MSRIPSSLGRAGAEVAPTLLLDLAPIHWTVAAAPSCPALPCPALPRRSTRGEGASELLHIGQAVMSLGGTLDYFVDTVFNYPTLAECYKVAAFNGLNRVSKFD